MRRLLGRGLTAEELERVLRRYPGTWGTDGSSEPTRTKRPGALEAPKVCRIKSAAVRVDSADTQGGMEPGLHQRGVPTRSPIRRTGPMARPTRFSTGRSAHHG